MILSEITFNSSSTEGFGALTGFVAVAMILITAIVHLAFATAVFSDAGELNKDTKKTFFVAEGLWCLAVLITGVFGATAYWLIHHSTLARQPAGTQPGGDK